MMTPWQHSPTNSPTLPTRSCPAGLPVLVLLPILPGRTQTPGLLLLPGPSTTTLVFRPFISPPQAPGLWAQVPGLPLAMLGLPGLPPGMLGLPGLPPGMLGLPGLPPGMLGLPGLPTGMLGLPGTRTAGTTTNRRRSGRRRSGSLLPSRPGSLVSNHMVSRCRLRI